MSQNSSAIGRDDKPVAAATRRSDLDSQSQVPASSAIPARSLAPIAPACGQLRSRNVDRAFLFLYCYPVLQRAFFVKM